MTTLASNRFYLFIIIPFLLLGCQGKPELIERKCSGCHKSSVVYDKKRTMAEWDRLVYGMEARGLVLSPDERKAVLSIIEKNYSVK